jgi:polar amino acid transport system ATP-binding protein/sulfate transport system ATP-binding protein
MSEQILLDVQNVSQTLGTNAVLKSLSFQVVNRVRPGVETGQIVGLLGPSGVGKTRLLRIIAGLDAPDTGRVVGPKGQPLPAGSVGVVFQNYPLLRHHTVQGNLEVAGRANGASRAEARERATTLLKRFRLDSRASYYPAQLSGGQRQRVAIAQQLVKQKTFMLLDEPFSGLDPAALEDVSMLLREVAHMDDLNTLVIVTHDVRAALLCADTLLLLGRDQGPDGAVVPGARIMETVDLVRLGLAWRAPTELTRDPAFLDLEARLEARFRGL